MASRRRSSVAANRASVGASINEGGRLRQLLRDNLAESAPNLAKGRRTGLLKPSVVKDADDLENVFAFWGLAPPPVSPVVPHLPARIADTRLLIRAAAGRPDATAESIAASESTYASPARPGSAAHKRLSFSAAMADSPPRPSPSPRRVSDASMVNTSAALDFFAAPKSSPKKAAASPTKPAPQAKAKAQAANVLPVVESDSPRKRHAVAEDSSDDQPAHKTSQKPAAGKKSKAEKSTKSKKAAAQASPVKPAPVRREPSPKKAAPSPKKAAAIKKLLDALADDDEPIIDDGPLSPVVPAVVSPPKSKRRAASPVESEDIASAAIDETMPSFIEAAEEPRVNKRRVSFHKSVRRSDAADASMADLSVISVGPNDASLDASWRPDQTDDGAAGDDTVLGGLLEGEEEEETDELFAAAPDDGLVDSEDGTRKSNRRRFRPLEFWRNEKVVYGRRKSNTFPTVVDVTKAGSAEEEAKKREQKEAWKRNVILLEEVEKEKRAKKAKTDDAGAASKKEKKDKEPKDKKDKKDKSKPKEGDKKKHEAKPEKAKSPAKASGGDKAKEEAEPNQAHGVKVWDGSKAALVAVQIKRTAAEFPGVGSDVPPANKLMAYIGCKHIASETMTVGDVKTDSALTKDYSVFFVTSGAVSFWLNEKALTLTAGHFFAVPAGNRYEMAGNKKATKSVVVRVSPH